MVTNILVLRRHTVLSSVVPIARKVAVNDQYPERDHSEVIKQMERNSPLANNHGGLHTRSIAMAQAQE